MMFVQQVRNAVDSHDYKLTATQAHMLLTMANMAKADGTFYCPFTTLAERCRIERANACRTVKRLIEAGWLIKTETGSSHGRSNGYQLCIPRVVSIKPRVVSIKHAKGSVNAVQGSVNGIPPTRTLNTFSNVNDTYVTPKVSNITKASKNVTNETNISMLNLEYDELDSLSLVTGCTLGQQYIALDNTPDVPTPKFDGKHCMNCNSEALMYIASGKERGHTCLDCGYRHTDAKRISLI